MIECELLSGLVVRHFQKLRAGLQSSRRLQGPLLNRSKSLLPALKPSARCKDFVGKADSKGLLSTYGRNDPFNIMYIDVQKRYKSAFAAFYGDSDDAQIQVLRQDGKTLFLNTELLARIDTLIDDEPLEKTTQGQLVPVK